MSRCYTESWIEEFSHCFVCNKQPCYKAVTVSGKGFKGAFELCKHYKSWLMMTNTLVLHSSLLWMITHTICLLRGVLLLFISSGQVVINHLTELSITQNTSTCHHICAGLQRITQFISSEISKCVNPNPTCVCKPKIYLQCPSFRLLSSFPWILSWWFSP